MKLLLLDKSKMLHPDRPYNKKLVRVRLWSQINLWNYFYPIYETHDKRFVPVIQMYVTNIHLIYTFQSLWMKMKTKRPANIISLLNMVLLVMIIKPLYHRIVLILLHFRNYYQMKPQKRAWKVDFFSEKEVVCPGCVLSETVWSIFFLLFVFKTFYLYHVNSPLSMFDFSSFCKSVCLLSWRVHKVS